MTKQDLMELLVRRDEISYPDAATLIDMVQDEVNIALDENQGLWYVEDILLDMLGLEPDYLDLFLLDY